MNINFISTYNIKIYKTLFVFLYWKDKNFKKIHKKKNILKKIIQK